MTDKTPSTDHDPMISRRDALKATTAVMGTAGTIACTTPASALSPVPGHDQWWRWRGPDGKNHGSPASKAPSQVSREKAVWSIKLPGRGHSTPIVAEDSLYLTTADKSAGTQSVLAVDKTGKARWAQIVHQGGLPKENHPNNTEASSTLAFDGQSLFASFYNSDAIRLSKLSTDGKLIWQVDAGRYSPNQYKYGYAASPLLYGDSVIINADYDGAAFLTAIDRNTGKTIWKVKRPGTISFSSPIIANVAGRNQLLLSGSNMVASYDPTNGQILWKSDGATTIATCGTMVWDDQRVFASGGYPEAETVCIAADGSGKVLWSNRTKCYEQSMLAVGGFIYAVADSGVAFCWRCTDGTTMWRQRLGGKYSSSPLLVGDTIFVFNEQGNGFSFAATPDGFQSRGQTKMADEIFSSPVVVDDTMYLRVADKLGRRQESLLALR